MGGFAGRLVGPAFTLRNIPMREDLQTWERRGDPDYPQRQAIETAPAGSVLVMDCRGDPGSGQAGDILVERLRQRGVAGLVADGPMRDSGAIAEIDFPVFCTGSAAPASMACQHAIELQVPIACGGAAVLPGDIMVGDEDGVVVVPAALAEELAADGVEQEIYEQFVVEQVRGGRSIYGLYPPEAQAEADYRQWRQARDRDAS